MTDLSTREQLAAWLRKQPRDVARILADRWTLRVLPIMARYESDLLSDLALPSLRVVAVSWAGVRFPDYEREPAFAAASAAGARAFAAAARAARATDAILGSHDMDDATIRASFAFAARAFAAAADDDLEGRAYAAAAGARAFTAIAGTSVASAYWSAIWTDAAELENGRSPSDIAGSPLWPSRQRAEVTDLWRELKAKLHAEKRGWQVWTSWYEDRLAGRVRELERELAYVRIEDSVWDEGPAVVNAEIEHRIQASSTILERRPATTEPLPATTRVFSSEVDAGSRHDNATLQGSTAGFRSGGIGNRSRACAGSTPISPPSKSVFEGFFSYSHDDAEVDPQIVEAFSLQLEKRVDARLVNATFELWRDNDKLRAGDYWDEKIKEKIGSADVLIVLLTPKWISSSYCREEFTLFEHAESARDRSGFIVPIYARDIDAQARFLESDQKALYDRIKRIQHHKVIPKIFARLSDGERIELIDSIADPICAMLDRLRCG